MIRKDEFLMELISLKFGLEFYELNDLQHIASNLGIKPNSENKMKIVNEICKEMIYNQVLNDVIICFDQTSLDIINTIVQSGTYKLNENDPYSLYMNALYDYGILLKVKNNEDEYYTIASEINEFLSKNIKKIQAEIKINAIIFKFAKAAVSYYGLLDEDEIQELYNYYHRYSLIDIFPRLSFFSKVQEIFTFNGDYLFDNNVKDIQNFVKDKEHFNLPFYKYTLEEFYVDERYIAIDIDYDFYKELEDYFTKEIECDPSIIVAINYFLMYEYDIESLKEAIDKETLIDVSKLDDRFEYYVKELYQYVRCWVLKGNMVSEVNEMIEENPKLYLNSKFVLLNKVKNLKKKWIFR